MIVSMPTATVYTVPLTRFNTTLNILQSDVMRIISCHQDASVYFTLDGLTGYLFSQDTIDKDMNLVYNARGQVTKLSRLVFPVSILRTLFSNNYVSDILSLLRAYSVGEVYLSVIKQDTEFFLKFIRIDKFQGNARYVGKNQELVCAKTSLYMDKAFAKAMPFPKAKLTPLQSVIIGHLFDCLYADDIVTVVTAKEKFACWITQSWMNEYLELAEMDGLHVRDVVNSIRQAKLTKKTNGKLTPEPIYHEAYTEIHPVDAFSVDFNKMFTQRKQD